MTPVTLAADFLPPFLLVVTVIWAVSHIRLIHRWARDGFRGPMPRLRQIRYHR